MDFNVYALERHVNERLADARAAAARRARLPARRPRRFRVELGQALIALGHRLIALEPAAGGTRA